MCVFKSLSPLSPLLAFSSWVPYQLDWEWPRVPIGTMFTFTVSDTELEVQVGHRLWEAPGDLWYALWDVCRGSQEAPREWPKSRYAVLSWGQMLTPCLWGMVGPQVERFTGVTSGPFQSPHSTHSPKPVWFTTRWRGVSHLSESVTDSRSWMNNPCSLGLLHCVWL